MRYKIVGVGKDGWKGVIRLRVTYTFRSREVDTGGAEKEAPGLSDTRQGRVIHHTMNP
jgi:hypothetical protein